MADIFVFGDSIGYGAWDEMGGWVDRLKQYFHQKKLSHPENSGTEVYNLSVDGDTSGKVAARIEQELLSRERSWSGPDDLVIVAIGTNDTYAKDIPTNFRTDTTEYRANLDKIFSAIENCKKRTAFISLDPVDESRTTPAEWGAYWWTNKRIKEFNETLEAFCKQNKLPYLNIFNEFQNVPSFKEMMFDGAHPNTAGHEWMFNHILPFVNQLLEQ
jgi:lysophospholipase L1-like esterase